MPHWNSLFTAFTCTFFCIFSSCSHLFAHSYFVRTVCPKIQACSDSRILDQHRWAGICHGSCRDSDCTGCVPFGNADLEIKMNFIAWAKVIASLVLCNIFSILKLVQRLCCNPFVTYVPGLRKIGKFKYVTWPTTFLQPITTCLNVELDAVV